MNNYVGYRFAGVMLIAFCCYASIRPVSIPKPFKVVLTGGPCGGKTSSIPALKGVLEVHGYKVFVVPETATMLQVGGVDRLCLKTDEQVIQFQSAILDLQMCLERNFLSIAEKCGQKAVLLMDRGALDAKGYTPSHLWDKVLSACGLNEDELLNRYDMVVHLVTTAIGAECFYEQHNFNGDQKHVRIETLEDSRLQDFRELSSWQGHHCRAIIDNSCGWTIKVERAANAIRETLEKRKDIFDCINEKRKCK